MTPAVVLAAILRLAHPHDPEELALAFTRQGEAHRIDPLLLVALSFHESSFHRSARSRSGKDIGLMQIRRGAATAGADDRTDEELEDPSLNVFLGARYFGKMLRLCDGEYMLAIAAYSGARCKPTDFALKVTRTFDKLRSAAAVPRMRTVEHRP